MNSQDFEMASRNRLLENLRNFFNESELRDLCFYLKIDYEALSGNNKSDKTRELITHLERHNRVNDLLFRVASLRPSATWSEAENVKEDLGQKLLDTHAETHFLKYFPETIHNDFESAQEAWIIGFSLVRNPYFSTIKSKLEKGHRIKVLVVHPDAPAVEMAVQRSFKPTDLKRKSGEIKITLKDLCNVKREKPNNLQIRVTRYPLTYGAHVINPYTESGIVYVKLYPFRVEGQKPKFVLRAAYGAWYQTYIEELEALWNSGEEWQCP